MTVSLFDQADAKHREHVVSVWRDWRAYLQANLDILAAQQQFGDDNLFEQSSTADEPESRARTSIAAIPPDRRRLFASVCATRRASVIVELEAERQSDSATTRTRAPDPDTIDERLYRALLDEAEGRSEDGLGRAPRDEQSFYGIEVDALLAAPDGAAYSIQRGLRTHGRLIGIVVLVVLGLVAVLVAFLGGRPSTTTPRAQAIARANDVALAPWAISAVELNIRGEPHVLPVSVQDEGGAWPSTGAGVGQDAHLPFTLCLPPDQLAQVSRLRLLGAADAPDRLYAISDAPTPTDLVLVACVGDTGMRYATLLNSVSSPVLTVGESVEIEGQTIQLQHLHAEGVDDDPTLPPEQVRIVATFAFADVDWAALNPVLTTIFGDVVTVGETRTLTNSIELRYLVPAFSAPMDAVLRMTPTGTMRMVQYRTTIAPPDSRAERLRRLVQVDALTAFQSTEALTLSLTLRSTDTQPLTLTQADLTLTTRDTTPLELVPFSLDLLPDVPATLHVQTLTAPVGDQWSLAIGGARYVLTIPERR